MSVQPSSSPLRLSNSEALNLSQQVGHYLQTSLSSNTPIPIPFLLYAESPQSWHTYERLLISCLRTGNDKAAHQCLEKLIERFGASNERVMGLRGLYQEAVAQDIPTLESILTKYDEVLAEDPGNTPISKRRIALLCSLSRTSDAIEALVALLEASPTDIEAWAELSDLYLSQGLYSQAEFCLEEVLLVAPNSWNIHARLGELLYISTANLNEESSSKVLVQSIRRFCRSVELCDDYIRGYYGLKTASDRLLALASKNPNILSASHINIDGGDLKFPLKTLNRLNEMAISKLAEITRRPAGSHSAAEVLAAKRLIERSTASTKR